MPTPPDVALRDGERHAIERALAADPWLAAELDLVVGLLEPVAAARFWRAFARRVSSAPRPSAAVLGAFEDAARRR